MSIPEVSVDELAELLSGGARLIDVREPSEFAEARVPGAVLVPLSSVSDRLDEFRGDGTTYVICARGGRSMRACEVAADAGVDVANVAGGTLGWIAAGHAVDAG
jgi:rhodanese-related sulfurtransferase